MAKACPAIPPRPSAGFWAAAQQGEANAESNLGYLYSTGQGTKRDYAEALRWFTAAEQGNPAAQVNLGEMYENGRGWFSLGAAQGYRPGEGTRKSIASIMT